MPEYTVATLLSMLAVIAIEVFWLRTGVFGSLRYWISMGIIFFFQALVDGWLTKLSDPIVLYHPDRMTGIRWPWDIPIEDFGFGFAMVTLTIIVWRFLTLRDTQQQASPSEQHRAGRRTSKRNRT
ncbi:MAG: lycopene cyclase domain-containing protein [Propioniciclava sp.]|uniref:lycopene cyclase domain-containing protein n=1 Tax=Propioniciclava sp. TaxID=2038686 RepID=UPI0039E2F98B